MMKYTWTIDTHLEETDVLAGRVHRPRFVSGPYNDNRIQVRWFKDTLSNDGLGLLFFGDEAMGPPQSAHGGAVAAVLDEAMGHVCWLHQHAVLAGKIEVRFLLPAPLHTQLYIRSQIISISGRKIEVQSRMYLEDQRTVAESKGLFIQLSDEARAAFEAYDQSLIDS
jgi:acyl-coenzyme A thioesterase PaaI-like protein